MEIAKLWTTPVDPVLPVCYKGLLGDRHGCKLILSPVVVDSQEKSADQEDDGVTK